MATPMKISIGVNIDAAGAKSGGASAQAAVAAIGTEAERTATKLQRLINSSVGLHGGAANRNVLEWTGALAAEGMALDNLRSKYNPLFAVIRQYKQTVTEIRTAHAQGALSTNEMTAALSRHRQATLASIDAIKGRNRAILESAANANVAGAVGPAGRGARAFETANIAAQFQDIAVTSAMGMNPIQIALQQGTQLATVIGSMERPAAGLLAAFTSLINPVFLVTIGVVAAAAATLQYFTSASDGAKSLEDLLKKEEEAIKRVRDLWGEAADERSRYGRESTGSASFGLEASISGLLTRLQEANADREISTAITSAVGNNLDLTGLTAREFRETPIFKALKIDFEALHQATVAGRPDVLGLIRRIEELGQASSNAGIKKMAEEAVAALKPFRDLAEALREAELARRRLFDDRGPNGRLLSQGTANRADMGDLALYESRQRVQLDRNRRAFDAEIAGLTARSPSERAEAARRSAASQFPDESAAERRQRIELAGDRALAQAEKELADARRDRMRSLEETMESQRLDLSLIGQTVAETERLRMEQRLTAELKAEAARNGVEIDQAELDLIRQKSAEYGRLAEKIAATNLLRDQADSILQLQTELSLVGANDEVRRRSLAQLQAEQQLRQRGISLGSAEADEYRRQAAAASELTNELRKQNDAWNKVRGAGEDAIDGIVDSLMSGDIKAGLADVAKDISKTFLELGVTNPLKNALLGTDYATGTDLKSVFSRLFGGGDAANPIAQSASAMNVSAGTVMINGGVGSGGLLSSFVGANDNRSTAAALTSGTGVDAQIRNYFAGKGLKSHQIAAIVGHSGAESSFNPLAVGDGGNAFGLFQHNDRGPALLRALGGRQNLGNVKGQLDFVWNELNTTENRAFQALLGSRNLREATAAFGGFERPAGFSWGNPEGMHNWAGRLSGAEQALEKFGNTTIAANQNLGVFGGGLGQFGNALTSATAGAGGGSGSGGLLSWFSSLFGGGFMPNGAQATWAFNGGIGLFANGGISDRPAIFGEGPHVEAAVPLPNGRSIPVDMRVQQVIPQSALSGRGTIGGAAAQPSIKIVNNSSGRVTEKMEETTDERGGRQFTFVMEDEVASAVSRPGSKADRAIRSGYGLRKRTARR